jgi:hypothetical protein
MPTQAQLDKITEVAAKLSVDPAWLSALIGFESNYDPQSRNLAGSGARGLIQFMPDTAQSYFKMSADQLVATYPDFDSQMDNAVLPYFQSGMPYPTKQSFLMQVFFPAAKYVSPSTTFQSLYQKYFGVDWQSIYNKFIQQNPGILMVADYVNYIDKRMKSAPVVSAIKKSAVPILGVIAAVSGIWLFLK